MPSSDAAAHLRVMLAWGKPADTEAFLRTWSPNQYTQNTIMTVEELRAEIAQTRARGYALSRGEFTEGMNAIAAPIFDRNGEISYIASFSYLSMDKTFDEKRIAQSLREALDRIHSASLAVTP